LKNYISFSPTQKNLEEIEKWLIEERDVYNEGFYVNWSLIIGFYSRNELAITIVNDKTVGFCCWRKTSEFSGQINIFEINRSFRRQGIGKLFLNELERYFLTKDILVIDLQCEPEASQHFWRKLNFIDVPSGTFYWSHKLIHLYKRLIPTLMETSELNKTNYIEIWDSDPIYTKNKESKWKWNLTIPNGRNLELPIIQACERNWRIKLVLDSKVVVDDKIKRFRNIEIDFGPYAIIRELPID
jgi:ribosomal protein S18 acetylase RimI-like enzyme